MEIVILAGAENDLWLSWTYYESLSPGLGDRFENAFRAGLAQIGQLPESAPFFGNEFRRLLLRRFQHGVFYQNHGQYLVVVAVLGLRQDPAEIRHRLGLPN